MTVVESENQELVLSKKPGWSREPGFAVKKYPHTGKNPTEAQKQAREQFGEYAKVAATRTVELVGEDRVKAMNAEISEDMTGFRASILPKYRDLGPGTVVKFHNWEYRVGKRGPDYFLDDLKGIKLQLWPGDVLEIEGERYITIKSGPTMQIKKVKD